MPSGNSCGYHRPSGLTLSYLRGASKRLVVSGRGGLSVSLCLSSSSGPSGCWAARCLTGVALSRHWGQFHDASIQICKEGSDTQPIRNRNERGYVFIWQCTLSAIGGDHRVEDGDVFYRFRLVIWGTFRCDKIKKTLGSHEVGIEIRSIILINSLWQLFIYYLSTKRFAGEGVTPSCGLVSK